MTPDEPGRAGGARLETRPLTDRDGARAAEERLDAAFPHRSANRQQRASALAAAAKRIRANRATIEAFAAPGREVELVALLLDIMAKDELRSEPSS